MSGQTVIEATEETVDQPPRSPEDSKVERAEKPERKESKGKDREPAPERVSPVMREIQRVEDQSIRDWLQTMGTAGSFRVTVTRTAPATLTRDGQTYTTEGFLQTYDEAIDEPLLREEWGGGTYALKVTRPTGEGGAWTYVKGGHRTVKIAGAPRLDRLPGHAPGPAAGAHTAGESPGLVKAVFESMKDQLDRAQKAGERERGIDPAMQLLIEQMREDARARDRQIAILQAKVDEATNRKPEGDPLRDSLLGQFVQGESSRIEAIRAAHEAELRTLRESHQQEVRILNERFDRDRDAMIRQHERTLDTIKQGYEREIQALRSLTDVSNAAAKGSHEVQSQTLKAEINRLDRENAEQRLEIKELRDKKEKSMLDMLGEVKKFKEALDIGDPKEAESVWAQIAQAVANPAALEQVVKIFRAPPAATAPVTAQAVVVPQQQVRRPMQVMRDARTGQAFVATPQGLIPAKKRPQKVAVGEHQIELPEVDASQVLLITNYLEKAFLGRTDPAVVAQSAMTVIPEKILGWIRDNDGRGMSGVDLFMSKVAKLPSTSPLVTMGGRKWLREVSRALTQSADTSDETPATEPSETQPEAPPTPPTDPNTA